MHPPIRVSTLRHTYKHCVSTVFFRVCRPACRVAFILSRQQTFLYCCTAIGALCVLLRSILNFSAKAHSNKQVSNTIFSNALVETLLIKLGDSALYVLFRSYKKKKQNKLQLLAPCNFQTQVVTLHVLIVKSFKLKQDTRATIINSVQQANLEIAEQINQGQPHTQR